jgi:hypothetical protein
MRFLSTLIAALKDPGPESSKLVTSITCPPRPAAVTAPKPSAPRKAGMNVGAANVSAAVMSGVSEGAGLRSGGEAEAQPVNSMRSRIKAVRFIIPPLP